MFENLASTAPQKYWWAWAALKAIVLGTASFFLAFPLSMLITIPWSKHYWAGDGQAVLGGLAVSFLLGVASAVLTAIYALRRSVRGKRAEDVVRQGQ